jgi:hypothetical protein
MNPTSLVLVSLVACGGDVVSSPSEAARDASPGAADAGDGGAREASAAKPSHGLPACHWPTSLDDGGPGGCIVGRTYLECNYPYGFSCDDGFGAASSPGVTQECVSDDIASCSGCTATGGAPTCRSLCSPNQYVMSCSGNVPADCVGVGGIAAGSVFSCCPCE